MSQPAQQASAPGTPTMSRPDRNATKSPALIANMDAALEWEQKVEEEIVERGDDDIDAVQAGELCLECFFFVCLCVFCTVSVL